ncbi:hypothetical protein ACP6OV_003604 [Cronobacter muytjensii]
MNYEKTKELAKSGHQLVVLLGAQNGMHEAASLVQRMAGNLDLLAVVLREKTKISDELLEALEALRERAEPMFYVSYKAAKRLRHGYTRFATMTTKPKADVSLPLYIAPPPAPIVDEIVGWVRKDDGDTSDPLFLCGSVQPTNGQAYNSTYYPVKRAAPGKEGR